MGRRGGGAKGKWRQGRKGERKTNTGRRRRERNGDLLRDEDGERKGSETEKSMDGRRQEQARVGEGR